MTEMNTYYAYPSAVGPVFDLARWEGGKSMWMGIVGGLFGVAMLFAAVFVWDTSLFVEKSPEGFEGLTEEIRDAHQQYPWPMRAGVVVVGLFGGFCVLGASSCIADTWRTDYYFRAGPGGMALRMPYGLSWKHGGFVSHALELELPWEEIENVTVVQHKRLGALSRNSGNLSAHVSLRTTSGERYDISIDSLSAPAYLIHERLDEAPNMQPAMLEGQLVEEAV